MVASDIKSKLIAMLQVGGRNQEIAFSVVHGLKGSLAAGCVRVFSADGFKRYFYALTFGNRLERRGGVAGEFVCNECRATTWRKDSG
jgi:hypothetical protein